MKHAVPISKAFLDTRTGTEWFSQILSAFLALGFDDILGSIVKKNGAEME